MSCALPPLAICEEAMQNARSANRLRGFDIVLLDMLIPRWGNAASSTATNDSCPLRHVYANDFWKRTYALGIMNSDSDLFSGDVGGQRSSVIGMITGLIDRTDISEGVISASRGIDLGRIDHDPEAVGIPTGSNAGDCSRNHLLRVSRKNDTKKG
jgi:hypothetical protein